MVKARVIQGDVLEVAAKLRAEGTRVDLVMCSPPYEAARTYGIDFNLKGQEWVDWAVDRYMACLERCDGLACWVVEGQTRQYRWSAAPVLMLADLHRRGVHLRKPPAFCRVGIPGSGGPDWLRNDWEWCVCGTNGGKLPWSENTAMGHPPKWAPGGELSHRLTDGTKRNQWGGGAKSSGAERKADGTRSNPGRKSHSYEIPADYKGSPEDFLIDECGNPDNLNTNPFGNQQSSGGRRADGSTKKPYFNGNSRRLEHGNPKGSTKVRFGQEDASHRRDHASCDPDGEMRKQSYGVPVLANPGNLIRLNVGGGQMGSALSHENEAPFPQKLCDFFIKSFCKPGGLVWDPFSGSGTTAAAALKAGRNVVASDIRQSQCDLTRRRIREAVGDLNYEAVIS